MKVASFDLHTHTNFSDGSLSPIGLLEKAHEYGLDTLAITDHDTVAAYSEETTRHAGQLGINLVPGIELSTRDEDGYRFHVLGYGIDLDNPSLKTAIDLMRARRIDHVRVMHEFLKSLGYVADISGLMTSRATPTKAHVADAVVEDEANRQILEREFGGHVPSRGQFIERLRKHPDYVESGGYFRPEEAADIIAKANGLSALAHPMAGLLQGADEKTLISKITKMPVDGLEAFSFYYDLSDHGRQVDMIDRLTELAHKLGKIVTGGSDFHKNYGEGAMFTDLGFRGKTRIPSRSILETVLQAIKDKQT